MKRNLHKIVSLLVVFLLSVTFAFGKDFTGGTKLYLTPNDNWKQAGARFAAYFFNNSTGKNSWVSMEDLCNGIYEVIAPNGTWKNVIFCRMNPSTTENNFDNKWNQSGDLTYDGSKNLFTVPKGAWDGSGDKNNWSKYTYTAEYKILGVGGDWDWADGLTFGPHPDANNKKEVLCQCLEVKESESIKVVKNGGCYYGKGSVKDGSVAVTYDEDDNIVLTERNFEKY